MSLQVVKKDAPISRLQLDLEPLLSEVESKKGELENHMKKMVDLSRQLDEYTSKVSEKKNELEVIKNQIDDSSKLLE